MVKTAMTPSGVAGPSTAITALGRRYSNKDTDGQVQPFSKDVYAEVEVVPIKGVWAGWGAITFYPEYPNGGSYHKVHRYRQGVLMEFSARGLVYRFDWFFFLNLVIATLVLLRVCGAVVDFIIFYCIPYRGEVSADGTGFGSAPRGSLTRPVRRRAPRLSRAPFNSRRRLFSPPLHEAKRAGRPEDRLCLARPQCRHLSAAVQRL